MKKSKALLSSLLLILGLVLVPVSQSHGFQVTTTVETFYPLELYGQNLSFCAGSPKDCWTGEIIEEE